MVSVPKITEHVPAPSKYETTYDWRKKDPDHTQKMVKGPVNSFIKQIEHKNKSPEKTTPAPHAYKNLEAWKHTSSRVTHTIKVNEPRTTFMEVQQTIANDTPAAKYPPANPVSFIEYLTYIYIDYLSRIKAHAYQDS